MNAYKNRYRTGGMMALLLSCLLLFACSNKDFLEKSNSVGEYSDYISFGVSPDEPTQTRAYADGGKDEYTAGQFVLRSTDSDDTLCVRAIVSDGIHSSADQQMVTRATPVTKDEFYDQFHVVAYWWKSDELADAFYMDADVTKNGDNTWSSADTYFWPGTGHTLQFYAWAPKDAGFEAIPEIYNDIHLIYLDYTVPENVAEQQDIVVANTNEIAGDHNAAVPLTFSHIFTAVRFEVGSQIQAGTIKSVALKGVRNDGVYYYYINDWTLTELVTDDFTQELNHTTTGSETAGSEITDASQTFMMLPQNLPDGATVEVVFADASGAERTLSASIAGTKWPQGQTVTYRISITPEYDTSEYDFRLSDERILDAHYEIYQTNLIVENVPAGTKWTITASDDATIQAQSDMNSFAQQGYWTDNNVNESGEVTSSARGYASYSGTGSGTFPIAIFVPENTGEEIMRTVKLTVKVGSNEVKTIEFYQWAPSWYGTGIGCERIEIEGEQQPWGFYWSNDYKLSFDLTACDRDSRENIRQYVEWTQALYESQDGSFIGSLLQLMFGDDIPDLGFVDMDKSDGDIADKITIDLGSIYEAGTGANIAQSETDGKSNTREMYNFKGIPFVNELINTLQSMGAVKTTNGEGTFPTNNAAIACMKLNSWDIVTVSDEKMLKLTNEDGNPDWYLPASDEISGIKDYIYPLSGDYWTSTSVTGSNQNAYKYDANGNTTEERRDTELHVRAVRKKP